MSLKIPEGIRISLWEAITQNLKATPSTVNDYRKVLNLMHSCQDGIYNLETLTPEQAKEYFAILDERVKAGTLGKNTCHRYKATLRSIGIRLEESGAIPGYQNPFRGLLKQEVRVRTNYTVDTFANPALVQQLLDASIHFTPSERLLVLFLCELGLTPTQICEIEVSDFHLVDGALCLSIKDTFMEQTNVPWNSSPFYLQGYPLTFQKASRSNICWTYTGTYVFDPSYETLLKDHIPTLGKNRDHRPYFYTSRHLSYTYRSIHHLISTLCESHSIPDELTPKQLSLYGMLQSSDLYKNPKGIRIGHWLDRQPLPQQVQVNSMKEQMTPEALLYVAGCTSTK